MAIGTISRETEPAGQVGFIAFGSVSEPSMARRAIRSAEW